MSFEDRIMKTALSFDDVLLAPRYSDIPLSEIDTSIEIFRTRLKLPILSAAMDTLTGYDMASAMFQKDAAGVVHKNMTKDEQFKILNNLSRDGVSTFGFAVSIGDYEHIIAGLAISENSFAVVDTAHADTKTMIEFIKGLCDRGYDMNRIVIGNISTRSAARNLFYAGAKVLKVGQGSGSICTTRIVAGIGTPQLQAIGEVADVAEDFVDARVIADGGIRTSGDIVKALAAGAHAVMLGGMLAGTDESLGGHNYRGMGSLPAMAKGSAARYGQTQTQKHTPEGVEVIVHTKGPVHEVLSAIEGGLRAGMGYTGSKNLEELREALFVRITNSGLRESHPHSYKEIKETINYKI